MKNLKIFQIVTFLLISSNIFGQVSGFVFQDYNGNGFRDLTSTINAADGNPIPVAVDNGIAGVEVKAYDNTGLVVGSATSLADGSYTIAALSGSYRLEFVNLPIGYYSTANGTSSSTSVQFVTAPATNINFGVNRFQDYSQDNPSFAVGSFNPLASNGSFGSYPSTYLIGGNFGSTVYSNGGAYSTPPGYNLPAAVPLSLHSQTGATWGIGWQRSTKTLYAGAYIKQFTDLGPGGTGAIYKIDMTNPASPVVTGYIDLNAIFGANTFGVNPFIPYPDYNLAPDRNRIADAVGNCAIGDIDVSEDEKWLYVTNLFNKKIYSIPIDGSPINNTTIIVSPTIPYIATPRIAYINPSYTSTPLEAVMINALEVKNGKAYVGTSVGLITRNISISGTDNPAMTWLTGFYIYEYDRLTNTFNSTPILRSDAIMNGGAEITRRGNDKYAGVYMSDIDFNPDGGITISTRAIGSDALGGPGGTITIKACSIGINQWEVEDGNGTCGGNNTLGYNAAGSGHWYYQVLDVEGNYKDRSAFGSSAQIPGFSNITRTSYDPYNVFAAGLTTLDNTLGTYYRGVEYAPIITMPATTGVSWDNKRGVLGDLEVLSDPAPIEIGNRVWYDVNKNGIQDPSESVLQNVLVELRNATDNSLIASAMTDANGNYYFSNATGADQTFAKFGLNLLPETAYKIIIPNISGSNKQSALVDYNLTTSNIGGGGDPDLRDSDGFISGLNAQVDFTTGIFGANNHSYDFGFFYCPADSIKICTGYSAVLVADDGYTNYVWYKINGPGDTVQVATGQTFTTSVKGNYIFKATDSNNCPSAMCCPVTVADSICCVIDNINLVIGNCDNKSTLTNAADDEYTFTLNPTGVGIGTTYTVSGLPNSPQAGTYGSPTTFGPYLISAGVLNISVVDDVSNTCTKTASVTPPPSCSVCNVSPPVLSVNDNICPNRTGTINLVQGCGAGTFIQYSINNGSTWSSVKPLYSTTPRTILARCVNTIDTTCKSPNTYVTTAPKMCPNNGEECTLTANATIDPCNNNGTDDIAIDDYFTIQINATVTNGGSSNKYEVVIGADPLTGIGGNVLNSSGTNYGSPVTVGNTKIFHADGSSSYQLIVRDINNNNCFQIINIDPVVSCSSAPPKSPCYPAPCVPIGLIKN